VGQHDLEQFSELAITARSLQLGDTLAHETVVEFFFPSRTAFSFRRSVAGVASGHPSAAISRTSAKLIQRSPHATVPAFPGFKGQFFLRGQVHLALA
jgi:hypothetical protein